MDIIEDMDILLIKCSNCKTNLATVKRIQKGVCPRCHEGFIIVDRDEEDFNESPKRKAISLKKFINA